MNKIVCPACAKSYQDAQNPVFIYSSRGYKSWMCCLGCKSYFMVEDFNPLAEVECSQVGANREETAKKLLEYKKRIYSLITSFVNDYVKPPAALLDVGCSYGGFLIEARKAGYNVYGFDIVSRSIEYVKSLGINAEICFSIGEVKNLQNASVDVITCIDTNYYWNNQPLEFNHAFSKLKPGGYMIMRVIDKKWLLSFGLLIRRLLPSFGNRIIGRAVNDHRFSMPLKSLLKVIRASGFDIIYASPRGAVDSNYANSFVKFIFFLGSLLWGLTKESIFLAPAAIIVCRKPKGGS